MAGEQYMHSQARAQCIDAECETCNHGQTGSVSDQSSLSGEVPLHVRRGRRHGDRHGIHTGSRYVEAAPRVRLVADQGSKDTDRTAGSRHTVLALQRLHS